MSPHSFFFQCYASHRDLHSFPTRRSSDLNILAILEAMPVCRSLGRSLGRRERWQRTDAILERFGLNRVRKNNAARLSGGDRKSTRLNSSHVESSYAVFCLKKKIIELASRLPSLAQIGLGMQDQQRATGRGFDRLPILESIQVEIEGGIGTDIAAKIHMMRESGGAEVLGAVGEIVAAVDGPEVAEPDFLFTDTATTEIYTLSLHDALPI